MNITSGKQIRPSRVVLYGVEGVGKTTLAASLPNSLLIDTENGSFNVDAHRVVGSSTAEFRAIVRELVAMKKQNQCPYEIIVLDTADRLWEQGAADVVKENDLKSIESMGFGKGLKMATEKFGNCLYCELDSLINAGLHVVCICHSKVETVKLPDSEEFMRYQLKVSAPGKQAEEAANQLKQWADHVLFCRFVVKVAKKDANAQVGRVVGAEKRRIATTHTAYWDAKNRVGLPDEIDMTPEALAPLFPKLRPATTGTTGTPATTGTHGNTQRPATGQNPGQGGSDPAELGFKAPALAHETPQQAHERSVPAAPAPTPAPQLPEALEARRDDLTAFLVSRGAIRRGQAVEDAPAHWLKRMAANPDGVLAALDGNK